MTLPGLLVTGTDTGVGKTRLAAAIVRALRRQGRRVAVFKPAATGCARVQGTLVSEDGAILAEASGADPPPGRVVPFLYEPALAPPVAARLAGEALEFACLMQRCEESLTWWSERAELVIVEGVGGFLCPLAEGHTVADFAVKLDYPVLIVARGSLGTINHTLLTCEAARRRGLRIAGVVMNQSEPGGEALATMTNRNILAEWLKGIPLLATLGYHQSVDDAVDAIEMLDWSGRALVPRRGAASSPGPVMEAPRCQCW
jgi:dethiobiotin synthetase